MGGSDQLLIPGFPFSRFPVSESWPGIPSYLVIPCYGQSGCHSCICNALESNSGITRLLLAIHFMSLLTTAGTIQFGCRFPVAVVPFSRFRVVSGNSVCLVVSLSRETYGQCAPQIRRLCLPAYRFRFLILFGSRFLILFGSGEVGESDQLLIPGFPFSRFPVTR